MICLRHVRYVVIYSVVIVLLLNWLYIGLIMRMINIYAVRDVLRGRYNA